MFSVILNHAFLRVNINRDRKATTIDAIAAGLARPPSLALRPY